MTPRKMAASRATTRPTQQSRGEITPYANAFAIDLNAALLQQLPSALDELSPVALIPENLDSLGSEHGVYQLFHLGQPVYIGKSQDTLRVRLHQHRRRCLGRHHIDVNDMSFRCLYVDKFVDAASPEAVLIKQYKSEGKAPWNIVAGFAPKDVGRGRKAGAPGKWFLDYPIKYNTAVSVRGSGKPMDIAEALKALRDAVPFDLFRYASNRSGFPEEQASTEDYLGQTVTLDEGTVPILTHLRKIIETLPVGWQATVQPSGITIYRESRSYPYTMGGWRHSDEGVVPLARGSRIPPGFP